MDKILITQFKDEIAAAILNSQKQLNPNNDAYIDKNELQGVLDFFGVDDVSKLLKTSDGQQSVFQNEIEETDESQNVDSVEITHFMDDEKDAYNQVGSAARELSSIINADLSLASIETPYSKQMEALEKAKVSSRKDGIERANVEGEIDALKTMVEDYLKENPESDNANNTIVKKITYGKDGSKKGILSQSFSLNGNSGLGEAVHNSNYDAPAKPEESESPEGTDTTEDTSAADEGNKTDVEVSYNMEFKTMNTMEQGNWHIKGKVNASDNNCDIHASMLYLKGYKDGSTLNFTGDIRQTIENQNNVASYGASVDYNKNKISTGLYGMYYSKELEGETTKSVGSEIYGKYGNNFRAAVGIATDGSYDYYYTEERAGGKIDLPSSGLSFKGNVSAEFGITKVRGTETKIKNTELKFRGVGSFKSKEFSADVGTNVGLSQQSTSIMLDSNEKISIKAKTLILNVLSNISTKNFNIQANVFSIKQSTADRPTVTTSITLGIKNFFGKNVMPILRYNFGNYEGAKHNVGAGVILMQ